VVDTPIDERKFTDQEVGEILKRAVEHPPPRALVKSEGLSLQELKAIGDEVGIDAVRLEDAARAVALERGNRPSRVLGAPLVLNFERKVDGELTPEDTPEILSIIRRTMGHQGDLAEVHGSLEWRAESETASRYVTISSKDGSTTISSSANLSGMAVSIYAPAGVVGGILSILALITAAKNGSQVGLMLGLAIPPVLYAILRKVYRTISNSESAKLQRVVDELARLTKASRD
jgi:hypothetical protein